MPSKPNSDHHQRDHLEPWQGELLRRIDAQAALNGQAGVITALQSWLNEKGPNLAYRLRTRAREIDPLGDFMVTQTTAG